MGNASTDRKTRQELRRKLKKWGMPAEEIELCIDQVKQRQREKNLGAIPKDAPICTRASYVRLLSKQLPINCKPPVLCLGDDYEAPNDTGYKPSKTDSVLSGVGRATGMTAKAVKRGKSITKFEYDEERHA